MKYLRTSLILSALALSVTGCYKPDYTCSCSNNDSSISGSVTASYHLGKISRGDAETQCSAIKAQYSWGTCIPGYPK